MPGLIDYREDTEGSVDTWEFLDQQRAEAPGNPIVPPGVSQISWIRLFAALDKGADAISRLATAFRFDGNGINSPFKRQNLTFAGPFGGTSNTGASEQSLHFHDEVQYNVVIPVVPGQTFTVEGQFFGEDPGDVQLAAMWGYNMPRMQHHGPIVKAAQLREADLADASESLVSLTGDLDGATSNFQAPPNVSKIGQIAYGVGVDVAGDTRIANQFEIDGDGFISPIKPQRWCGVFGTNRLDTEGGETYYMGPERFVADFSVVAPRQDIIARAGMVEDDYGAGTAFLNLHYV